jgi:UDP-2,3-diacylglucosamine pyrophosphatase LpxH
MSREVIIDKINIRLPKGWQGDASHLALQVAEQIQRQVADLHSVQQRDFILQGHFAGSGRRVAERLGTQLATQAEASVSRRRER